MMLSACGCATSALSHEPAQDTPWWQDRMILIPAAAGLTLLIGVLLDWFVPVADVVATILFWVSLLLGASQFVPGALRRLFRSGNLASISAVQYRYPAP